MSSADLAMAIGLVVAVAILGAAMFWAFMNAHRDSARGGNQSLPRRPKSRNQSLKSKGG